VVAEHDKDIIDICIHILRQTDLFEVAYATGTAGAFARSRKCWQQHCRQYGNNGYYDQQLDQSELFFHKKTPFLLYLFVYIA
jgi:hypothetical protein